MSRVTRRGQLSLQILDLISDRHRGGVRRRWPGAGGVLNCSVGVDYIMVWLLLNIITVLHHITFKVTNCRVGDSRSVEILMLLLRLRRRGPGGLSYSMKFLLSQARFGLVGR